MLQKLPLCDFSYTYSLHFSSNSKKYGKMGSSSMGHFYVNNSSMLITKTVVTEMNYWQSFPNYFGMATVGPQQLTSNIYCKSDCFTWSTWQLYLSSAVNCWHITKSALSFSLQLQSHIMLFITPDSQSYWCNHSKYRSAPQLFVNSKCVLEKVALDVYT